MVAIEAPRQMAITIVAQLGPVTKADATPRTDKIAKTIKKVGSDRLVNHCSIPFPRTRTAL